MVRSGVERGSLLQVCVRSPVSTRPAFLFCSRPESLKPERQRTVVFPGERRAKGFSKGAGGGASGLIDVSV